MSKNKLLKLTATPLTIFTSLVVLISGVFMFFDIKNHTLSEIHAQVGLLMVFGTILHFILNWRPLVNYFKKAEYYLLIIPVLLIIGGVFLRESENDKPGINPRIIFMKVENSSVQTVSQLFQIDSQIVIAKMKANGINVENVDETLHEIAEKNRKEAKEVLSVFASFETKQRPR